MLKNFLWFFAVTALLLLVSCGGRGQTTAFVYEETPHAYAQGEKESEELAEELLIYEYPTTITGTAELPEELYRIFMLYERVLRNEIPFSCEQDDVGYVYHFIHDYNRVNEIAVVDLNGDGIPEIIACLYPMRLILTYYDGEIFGSSHFFRSMTVIKTDGTHIVSGGASVWAFRIMHFNQGIIEIENIYYFMALDYPRFYINYEKVSQEEFNAVAAAAWEMFNAKEDITWHTFTAENLMDLWQYTAITEETTTFRTVQRIHHDIPEFTFYRIIGDSIPERPEHDYFMYRGNYVTILVKDGDGNLLQEIDKIQQGGPTPWFSSEDNELFGIQFDDFNFDGYLDMWVHTAFNSGTAGGAWAAYWLWESETGQFVQNEQLSLIRAMANLGVDTDTADRC